LLAVIVSSLLIISATVAKQSVEVVIFIREGPETDMVKAAAEYWNKHYAAKEGIVVKYAVFGRPGYFEKITTTLLARSPDYDIMWVLCNEIGRFAAAGVLEPLDKYVSSKELYPYGLKAFFPASLDSCRYKGKLYALPSVISTFHLYYRKDLINKLLTDKAWKAKFSEIASKIKADLGKMLEEVPEEVKPGIRWLIEHIKTEPVSPDKWTWSDFLVTAAFFTKSHNPGSPTEYGTTIMGKRGECPPKEWYMFLWSFGGDFFKHGTYIPTLNSSAAKQALTFWASLLRRWHVVPPDVDTYEYPEVLEALRSGKVAFSLQWDAAYPDLTSKEKSPLVWDKIAITYVPIGPNGRHHFIHTWTFVLNAASLKKEAAFKVLAWLTSSKEGGIFAAKYCGPIPRSDIMLSEEILKMRPDWKLMANEIAKYGHAEAVMPEWPKIHDIICIHLVNALAGVEDPVKACNAMNSEIYALLKSAGYYG